MALFLDVFQYTFSFEFDREYYHDETFSALKLFIIILLPTLRLRAFIYNPTKSKWRCFGGGRIVRVLQIAIVPNSI